MKNLSMIGLFVLSAVVFSFPVSCGGGGEGDTTPNPVASAGPDQYVLTGSLVTLDGSGSSNASTYAWTFKSWPGVSAPTLSPSPAPNIDVGPYWSSTPFSDIRAWGLSSLGGFVTNLKTATDPVRCVRGAMSSPFLIDNGDGTVTDLPAGLMWQKQADNTARTWVDSINYCEGLSLGGHDDWRMPNAKELSSIVDTTKQSPAVDTTYFAGISSDVYWSSTTYVANPWQALTINFNYGATDVRAKESGVTYVWCVRGL